MSRDHRTHTLRRLSVFVVEIRGGSEARLSVLARNQLVILGDHTP